MYPAMNLISSLKAGNLRWTKPGETLKIFLQTRKIYSLTKKWDRYLTTEKKKEIETFWASKIKQPSNLNEVNSDKKYYILSMFPYPSGKLHMGHVRVYTISDSLSRFHKMNGKEVLHPMGWDAFGLPAENAALDRGVSPADWTVANIGQMKQQLEKLGCDFDWDREIATCSPDYYKWTQYLFVQLFKQGLAYQQEALVNWDPVDKTVLADEQVDAEGRSWRSGAKVEKVPLKQWFVKTTSFAESLVQGLDDLNPDDWKDIIQLQKHWLGECNGYRFEFQIEKIKQTVSVWTSHPEDLQNVSFIGIKPGHILDKAASEKTKLDQSKSLNFFATNPLTGANIPVIVTDELDYAEGTDSMLGVPSRDPEALDIAQRFKLKIAKSRSLDEDELEEERAEICNRALEEGWGGYKTSSKLRDWLISRQRYWGTPIPIIHCKNCGAVPVPEENLPVELPVGNTTFSRGKSGLKDNEEWKKTDCPRCTAPATRETDTMDTFVDSSWYFLRYTDPRNQNTPFDIQKAGQLMPVDMYIGGKEHAVLHLYYARFVSHFLYSLGWLKQREPFRRLLVQGMVMGQTFQVKGSGKYLKHEEVDFSGKKPIEKGTGNPVTVTWEKMSKSKYNGVEPESVWDEHGIDTTRLLILANFTPRSHRHWSSDTFPGVLNWQTKLWSTITKFVEQRTQNPDVNQISQDSLNKAEKELWELRNACVFHVTHNYSEFQLLSVAIARLQALTGSIKNFPAAVMANSVEYERTLGSLLILMAPLAPHFTSELWTAFTDHALKKAPEIDWDKPVLQQKWPTVDKEFSFGLSCQVNGEEIGLMKMSSSQLLALNQEAAVDLALQQEFVLKHCDKDKVKNTIFEVLPGPQARVNLITEKRKKEKKEKKQKKKDSETTDS